MHEVHRVVSTYSTPQEYLRAHSPRSADKGAPAEGPEGSLMRMCTPIFPFPIPSLGPEGASLSERRLGSPPAFLELR